MTSSDIIFGIILAFQTCIGFIGNSLLFTLYLYTLLRLPHKKKPADVILANLTLANSLTLVYEGIPNIMFSFGIMPEMGDIGCKTVLYIQRVTRSLSLCTSSLQSTFQAVVITPSNVKWARLKNKICTFIQPSLLFVWILNMVIYSEVILRTVANRNSTEVLSGYYTPFCKVSSYDYQVAVTFISSLSFRDLLFLSVMACSSIYMVTFLSRHHRKAQHVRSTIGSSQSSPEIKATQVILILLSCFIFFYLTNTFLTIYSQFSNKKNWQLENFKHFISTCYPTVCPLVLIKNENRISTINFIKTRKRIFSL